jgi:hypothetical protein
MLTTEDLARVEETLDELATAYLDGRIDQDALRDFAQMTFQLAIRGAIGG